LAARGEPAFGVLDRRREWTWRRDHAAKRPSTSRRAFTRSTRRRTRMQPAADAPIVRGRPVPAEFLQGLGERFGERCSTGESVRPRHGRDDSPYDTTPPDCVVFPTSSDEVAEIVRMCARHRVPVIAYGAGTSIEGHIMAVEGGVTIDLSRMNRVLA